jgi:predicted metalloendopeptidase
MMAMLRLAPKLQHELQAALEQQPWLTTITRSAAITKTKTETES